VAPSFVEDRRRAALEVYESQEVPTWRRSGFWTTTLRGLDLDALEPKRYDSLDSAIVRDHLGDEDHAALIVQQGANIVHCDVTDDRIIVMPLEEAVEKHADLVEEHFAKRLPYDEGKFPAGTAAFWSGGVFVYVPDNVQIEKPIQAVWLIEEPGTVQWAHSRVRPRTGLRGPGSSRRRVRALCASGRSGASRPLPGLGLGPGA
jgi:Fe-S cluster assembly protein SufD